MIRSCTFYARAYIAGMKFQLEVKCAYLGASRYLYRNLFFKHPSRARFNVFYDNNVS